MQSEMRSTKTSPCHSHTDRQTDRQTDTSHLALLADDWHVILQLYVIEQRLQEDVSDANQTVIFA